MKVKQYGKLRVLKDKESVFCIQKPIFGGLFWRTIFKTYSQGGVEAFLNFSNLEYDTRTGNYVRYD